MGVRVSTSPISSAIKTSFVDAKVRPSPLVPEPAVGIGHPFDGYLDLVAQLDSQFAGDVLKLAFGYDTFGLITHVHNDLFLLDFHDLAGNNLASGHPFFFA